MSFTDEQIDCIIKNCLSFYKNTRQLEASSDYVRDKLSKSKSVVATHNVPINIVNDMLNMIDKEIWHNPDATVLEMAAIGNHFFSLLFLRFYFGLESKIPDRYERARHILTKQIYMFSLDLVNCMYTRTLCYGNAGIEGNCFWCRGVYQDENKKWCEKQITDVLGTLKELSLPLFKNNLIIKGLDKDMKFDIVIGNPPYNDDIYIDFVNLGFELLKDTGIEVMITPAKWQAKSGQKNEAFRQNIVPHMSKIVYYPDCTDIFVIQEADGMCYYLINKDININKEFSSYCRLNSRLSSSTEIRPIEASICNVYNNIIKKVTTANFSQFKPESFSENKFMVYSNDSIAIGGKAHKDMGGERYTYLLSNKGNLMCISKSEIVSKGNEPIVKNSVMTFSSDDEEKCKSFIKWTELRFTRFLFLCGLISRNSVGKDIAWRFVPDPGAFDHIFTDEELYKKYNLTDEEINIIESVIKERK